MRWKDRKRRNYNTLWNEKKLISLSIVFIIFFASFTMMVVITPNSYAEDEAPTPRAAYIRGTSWCEDNFMRQRLIYRGTNYGGLEYIIIDAYGSLGWRNRGLIRFDVKGYFDSLGKTVEIQSAILKLYFYDYTGNPLDDTMQLYRIRECRDWGETTSSWSKYKTGTSWTEGGCGSTDSCPDGDRESGLVPTTVPSCPDWMTWSGLMLSQDVIDFYNTPSDNNGWMFKYEDESGGERISYFRSSEYSTTPAQQPTLVVTYYELPTSQSNPPTGVEEQNATIWGYVIDDGGDNCTGGFYYSNTDSTPDSGDTSVTVSGSQHNGSYFSKNIPVSGNLLRGERYFVRAWLSNYVGVAEAENVVSFLTKPQTLTNFQATATSANSILLTWTNGDGGYGAYIEYLQTASEPPTWNIGDGNEIGYKAGSLFNHTGRNSETTYWYKAWPYANDGGWKSTNGNTSAPFGDTPKTDDATTPATPEMPSLETYYFTTLEIEEWEEAYLLEDGDEETFAVSPAPGLACTLIENTCTEDHGESISKVEIRAKVMKGGGDNSISLAAIFDGTPSEQHGITGLGVIPAWSQWFDITNDEGKPALWTWQNIPTIGVLIASGHLEGEVFCSKIELRVSFLPINATLNYRFLSYRPGGNDWTNAGNMVNGNEESYANSGFGGQNVYLDGHTGAFGLPPEGTIKRVELRAKGYYSVSLNSNDIILRSYFGEQKGEDHIFDCSDSAGWSDWIDITHDAGAPGTWEWEHIGTLCCDVISGDSMVPFELYCSQVEIRITYIEWIAPKANFYFYPDSNIDQTTEITFDASGSYAQGYSTITSYKWDFDNDGDTDIITAQSIIKHYLKIAKTYQIKLTVVADHGKTDIMLWGSQSTIKQKITLKNGVNYISWGASAEVSDEDLNNSYLNLTSGSTIQKFDPTSEDNWGGNIYVVGVGGDGFTIYRWDHLRIVNVGPEKTVEITPDGYSSHNDVKLNFSTTNKRYNYVSWFGDDEVLVSYFCTRLSIQTKNIDITVYNQTTQETKVYNPYLSGIGFPLPDGDFYIDPYDIITFKTNSQTNTIDYGPTQFPST